MLDDPHLSHHPPGGVRGHRDGWHEQRTVETNHLLWHRDRLLGLLLWHARRIGPKVVEGLAPLVQGGSSGEEEAHEHADAQHRHHALRVRAHQRPPQALWVPLVTFTILVNISRNSFHEPAP